MEAELYNTDVEAGNIGNLSVESKYSKFRVGNAGLVAINSYSDKYAFARTGDVTFVNKYSELKTEASGNMTLDCYSTTLELGKVENIELKSKYGKYEVDELGNLHSSNGIFAVAIRSNLSNPFTSDGRTTDHHFDFFPQVHILQGFNDISLADHSRRE